ncbi:nucleotide exchange factor GrpE [Paeniglutamicibacter sp. NPDC091659]|uniref:nucleotide exchange factor GrpE n=1 Tax=Paeniglutamicibacter sp. NPDC091659 TaxID=3364389 RepID=UPI00380171EE
MSEEIHNEGASNEEVTPVDEAHDSGDALSQAEAILNEAAAQGTVPDKEAELREDLQRLQAEYVNYRKRVERDREAVRELAVQSVLNNLLPVLDDIDAARAHGDLTDGPFASIANKLDAVLEGLGLERINEAGVAFDPAVHEALLQQPNPEIPADHVAMVLRAGFKKGDRIMRAAQVIVSLGE